MKKQGFTLIELLVVSSLIIVLTGLSIVNFRQTGQKSRNGKREADISQVRSALELYRASNSNYPIYSGSNKVVNFNSLLSDPNFRPLLSTPTLVDPTNTAPYQYTYQSAANGFTYTICYTTEPDAQETCLSNP
jgi:prepilin-type N-terminal cleavage/methylation domain-containing protein